MKESQSDLKVGDSVMVKPGTKDPDTGGDIDGWQGRIIGFGEYEGGTTVGIAWDSITLKTMPFSSIEYSEKEGLDWKVMYLNLSEVEPAKARDTERDIKRALDEIDQHTHWLGPDEEDKRIQKVLDGIAPHNIARQLKAWDKYLRKMLTFPFKAEIAEWRSGPLEGGGRVTVQEIVDLDEHYGIIVRVKHEGGTFHLPLCDLQATTKELTNYQPVKDYAVWFANR